MATKAFDIQDVLKAGWEGFKGNILVLIVLLLLSFAASLVIGVAFSFLPPLVLALLNAIVTAYLMLSLIKAVVMINNGETASFSVLKNDINMFLRFLAASICLSIIFSIAAVFFILPLFLAMAIFFPVPYIIVDRKDLSIVDAFKKSWAITTSNFGSCLLFVIVMMVLVIIGIIPVGLGLLIVVPVCYLAGGLIYKKLDAASSSSETKVSAE